LLLAVVLLAVGVAAAASPRPPAAPTVLGPRRPSSTTPAYRFRAARALSFRCAFDNVRLHRCRSRYSQRLAPGAHILRVRALGAGGTRSRVVKVTVHVAPPLSRLEVGSPMAVGPGPGVPTVANGAVWVPTTNDGGLVKVLGSAVVSRTQVGPRSLSGEGYLDTAAAGAGAIWSASDIGSTIARFDPASGGAAITFAVPERPGGLTEGGGAVWAFHFLQPAISRIDEARTTVTRFDVPSASGVGLAYGGGSLWLLSVRPTRILELDPRSGAVRRTISLNPTLTRRGSLIDAWWLAYGEGAVWATLPNHHAVARVDASSGAVRYVALDQGQPFGVAGGGGSAWVATDRAIVRLDGTGAPVGAATLPRTQSTAFVSVAYRDGAAWVTNFDRGTLTRVDDPAAP